jgi:16S rRNA (guanine966-N2)-methyltransferase
VLRVIAGRFGGRRLKTPRGEAVRPTADRVKEALFSMLGNLHGARVLDLFAGTGSLGIECLSRGAVGAVFVEAAPPALEILRENLRVLGLAEREATVVAARVERALPKLITLGPHDLVLADAPYAEVKSAARAADQLADGGAISDGARLVIEHAAKDAPGCERWQLVDRRAYGTTALSIFELRAASA